MKTASRRTSGQLSAHGKAVLALLRKNATPLSAYDILAKLRGRGVKAPPTVYRALEALVGKGLVHRIESLGAFVACHSREADHGTQFTVCRGCRRVEEIHDHRICDSIHAMGRALKFRIERERLELWGLCDACHRKQAG